MNHTGTEVIATPRLILRPFTADDVQNAFDNWCSDGEVTRFLTWPAHTSVGVTRQIVGQWIKRYADPSYYQWAIELKSIAQPVGTISAVDINEKLDLIHIGYCIGRRWWHRGIMSEALGAVIPFFFETVGANRIESRHDPNNPHSGQVMQKCGMRYEGTLRQADYNNQGIVDACMYSILKTEFRAGR